MTAKRATLGRPAGSAERPAVAFADAAELNAWLEAHHDTETGIWVLLHKKHAAHLGITWPEAVDEALCYGWIDSIAQRIDDDTVRQRFTPRTPGSTWSLVNVANVARLTEQGRMRPAGLAAYEARRPDRTGIYSFEQDGDLDLPEPYAALLAADPRAAAWWAAATPGYRRIATHWVLGAKQEATRDSRMAQLVDDSAHGRLIKSQRYGAEPSWCARARAQIWPDGLA